MNKITKNKMKKVSNKKLKNLHIKNKKKGGQELKKNAKELVNNVKAERLVKEAEAAAAEAERLAKEAASAPVSVSAEAAAAAEQKEAAAAAEQAATGTPEQGNAQGQPTGEQGNASTITGKVNNKQLNKGEINKKVKEIITKLSAHLGKQITISDEKPEAILNSINDANLLGDFNKELYKFFNSQFKDKDDEVMGQKLMINNKFNQLLYTQVVNGKLGKEHPTKTQKEHLEASLREYKPAGKPNGNKGNGNKGNGAKGGKKNMIKKNKKKLIKKK